MATDGSAQVIREERGAVWEILLRSPQGCSVGQGWAGTHHSQSRKKFCSLQTPPILPVLKANSAFLQGIPLRKDCFLAD